MPDIYGKSQKLGNTKFVTADRMKLRVSGNEAPEEFLVQQVSIQYNQPLNRIFEIGSPDVFFAPGRAIGTCQIGRIIGTHRIDKVLGKTGTGVWSTASDPNQCVIEFEELSGGTAPPVPLLKFKMTGAKVESWAGSTDANGLLFQENVSLQFASLEFL